MCAPWALFSIRAFQIHKQLNDVRKLWMFRSPYLVKSVSPASRACVGQIGSSFRWRG